MFSFNLYTDRKVWAFSGYDLVPGYPKSISSFGLPTSVKKIDAALYDVESAKTLFFVDRNYYRCVQILWREINSGDWFRYVDGFLGGLKMVNQSNYCLCFFSYDEAKKAMDPGFPRSLDQAFSGLTSKVTAAFQYRGE